MKKFLVAAACMLAASPVLAQDPSPHGSVYSSFGSAAFVRGGYIFAAHGGGASGDASAPLGSIGYHAPFSPGSQFGFETELVYLRDSETIGPITATAGQLTALISLRWQYETGSRISPFVSAGIGPAYIHAKIDNGVTEISDSDLVLGYSGRAGVEIQLSDGLALETAYRYLGATDDGTAGFHAAEAGLNFTF